MSEDGPRWPGHAVLQVPVRLFDPFVRERYAHYDPSLLGRDDPAGDDFVHAHVTVLGPFDEPPDGGTVSRLARRVAPFRARCDRVDTFGNGIVHAVAAPVEAFEALVTAAMGAFPGTQPYRGTFGVHPHVTLDALGPDVDEESVRAGVAPLLGVAFDVDALDVVWYEQDGTRLVARHALAGTSPSSLVP